MSGASTSKAPAQNTNSLKLDEQTRDQQPQQSQLIGLEEDDEFEEFEVQGMFFPYLAYYILYEHLFSWYNLTPRTWPHLRRLQTGTTLRQSQALVSVVATLHLLILRLAEETSLISFGKITGMTTIQRTSSCSNWGEWFQSLWFSIFSWTVVIVLCICDFTLSYLRFSNHDDVNEFTNYISYLAFRRITFQCGSDDAHSRIYVPYFPSAPPID